MKDSMDNRRNVYHPKASFLVLAAISLIISAKPLYVFVGFGVMPFDHQGEDS
jgi:hypothetical protein